MQGIGVAKPFSLLSVGSNLGLNSMEDSIRLWIALAPPQMEELRTHHRIQPDIFTSRIDLSATQMRSLGVPQMFNGVTLTTTSITASSR